MQTGQIIAELRTEAGITQEQLAEKLFVSRDLVSKWETGKRLPSFEVIRKLSSIFEVSPDELINPEARLLDELESCFPGDFDPEAAELKELLNAFLNDLSDRNRSVFVRRYYFFETPTKIGENFGISENHVRTILMRCRKRLKRFLKEHLDER